MKIKIKKLPHCFAAPEHKTAGSVGADLYAAEMVVLAYRPERIRTGVCLEIPKGYQAQVLGRSGLALQGIFIATGTIDADYRGEICVIAYAPGMVREIVRGSRIAQLVVSPVVQAEFEEVVEL